jgi:predicted short-subunit dehydrogenase-like oxidoreductase (DUF2520 family)
VKLRQRARRGNAGVAIVGPGRVGQALGKLLASAGVAIHFVAARRPGAARRAVRFIGCGVPLALDSQRLAEASVVLLTAADAALEHVARHLAALGRDWSGKVVLHTCGSLPSTVLQPLRRRGAATGSLHPFQTIPNPAAGVRNLKGCFWAIEGDAAARKVATKWVKALGGVAFRIRASQKTLYHAAAFLVCPTLITLMDRSAWLLRKAGVPGRVVRPMLGQFVEETVRNYVRFGGRRALTGPAVRGDWSTIRRHLRALRRSRPDIIPLYLTHLRAMLHLVGRQPPPPLGRILKR